MTVLDLRGRTACADRRAAAWALAAAVILVTAIGYASNLYHYAMADGDQAFYAMERWQTGKKPQVVMTTDRDNLVLAMPYVVWLRWRPAMMPASGQPRHDLSAVWLFSLKIMALDEEH